MPERLATGLVAALLSAIAAAALFACDDREPPTKEKPEELEAQIDRLRNRVERSNANTADAIRAQKPDTGLELPPSQR